MLTMYMRSCILEPVREGLKSVEWKGDSLERARSFSKPARQQVGYELELVQRGLEPSDWKPMPTVGPGVCEVRIHGTVSTESSTLPGTGMQSTYFTPSARRRRRHQSEISKRRRSGFRLCFNRSEEHTSELQSPMY